MIDAQQILTEMNRVLAARFPDHLIYVNLCPNDFERPSFFIESVQVNQKDASRACILETNDFTITYLPEVDEYGRADTDLMMQMQRQLLNIVRPGYLRVADRAIGMAVSGTGGDLDYVYVNCQAAYFEDRSDEIDTTPLMETIEAGVRLS